MVNWILVKQHTTMLNVLQLLQNVNLTNVVQIHNTLCPHEKKNGKK